MLLRRTVRGMINYRSQRGKAAFRKLKVFIGVPEEYDGKAQPAETKSTRSRHVTVEELSTWLGWKNPLKE
jgi:large subunit ribosomal protein L13